MIFNLKDIARILLNEEIDTEAVRSAIQGHRFVRIHYNDQTDSAKTGLRTIQPMAVGTTKKGYPVVRAFQVGGSSRRGAPKWKFFRLDRITSWKPLNKRFYGPPNDLYNPTGDKSMQHFIDNAKFGDLDTPLERERARLDQLRNAPKVSVKNTQGQVGANQQWKRNVFTSQPNSQIYQQAQKNLGQGYDFNKWADYDLAQKEAEDQRKMEDVPMPEPNWRTRDDFDEEDYDDFNEDDFFVNQNTRNPRRR